MVKNQIMGLIKEKNARIGVIGLGYVGLPLAVEFARSGFKAIGFEVDKNKVDKLNSGDSYIGDVSSSDVKKIIKEKLLRATLDFSELKTCDCIIICVPTPLRKTKEPDISYILSAAEGIKQNLRPGQLIILESTTYPGTTDEVLLPIFEENGLKLDKDFLLAFSPERVDPGNPSFQTHNIPKVVGGCTMDSTEVATLLYSQIVNHVHPVSSARVAEAAKLLENTFRAVNIGMANEMARLCYALDIDTWEVIKAAATKPFGFMPFYPGPGIGGHCLIGKESVLVEENGSRRLIRLDALFEEEASKNRVRRFNVGPQTEVIYKPDLKALSIDTEKELPVWSSIHYLFKREYEGELISVTTSDNRRLTVTDKHPMLVYSNGHIEERLAQDLRPGDQLPLHYLPPPIAGGETKDITLLVDMFDLLPADRLEKIGVHIKDAQWDKYLKKDKRVTRDHLRCNRLPASIYLELEKDGILKIPHERLHLVTGKGPSHTSFPAIIKINSAIARLIGYYLAEGCITAEKNSNRVRLTFNSNEEEYIHDVQQILKNELGLQTSVYYSKVHKSATIRVASRLFGDFLSSIGCGDCSYNMRIPEILFNAPISHRIELLKGLFRGDGDVYLSSGISKYTKNGRAYEHSNVSVEVGYFSSSPQLFQQVLFLLQSLGFLPTIKRNKPHLCLKGKIQIERLKSWFLGDKKAKIDNYLRLNKRVAKSRTFQLQSGWASVPVKSVERYFAQTPVYSVEVDNTHTFATSYGIYVHNCIPLDPHYLSWKARQHGFDSRFIGLAEEVNSRMPQHVVQLVIDGLNDNRKALNGSRILLLGVAYKKNIDDVRESPALSIIDLLRAKGAHVNYHDPFVEELRFDDAHTHGSSDPLKSVPLTNEELNGSDCVVIVTDHSNIDYARVVDQTELIVDTRNALNGDVRRSSRARIIRL